uniref:Ac55 n=1 Tax=Lymantria dispar multicapsid nuclear polyhedrosis virus TaxID=10449 RepID=A0A140HQT3_NPVLD|nr:hypothetical protein [Lymantria dispar multiple nucleopolyhedrovirus]QDE14914.1 ac55 [Lymantria dispar multiple nucleopolyhedrovirus]QDH05902.1 ORF57 [Lymantria dispar multiple nucleopolyhedrovirus]
MPAIDLFNRDTRAETASIGDSASLVMDKKIHVKMENLISKTIDSKLKKNKAPETRVNVVHRVGRTTTYDAVGERNYKNFFDEKNFVFTN